MNKKLIWVIIIVLLCIVISMNGLKEKELTFIQELEEEQGLNESIIEPVNESFINEPISVSTTELDNLIQFLEEDKTDEINYIGGQRGINYFVCTGFSRALAENASKYNITMGAISLRDTPSVGCVTKYYHAMNYIIADDSFIIIEPQTDEVFYLDLIGYHHGGVYRYISIYQNAQMMSNYGKGRETIDIDLRDYNETEIINKWEDIIWK